MGHSEQANQQTDVLVFTKGWGRGSQGQEVNASEFFCWCDENTLTLDCDDAASQLCKQGLKHQAV